MRKRRYILLSGIILLALAVRIPGILQGNFSFTYDTGRDLLAVRDLVMRGNVSLIGPTTGLHGVFYGPWWYWLLVPPFVLFGANPIGMTVFMALISTVTAAVAFLWGTKKRGIVFGGTLGLLLAGSRVIVEMTSQLWNPDVLVLLTVAVVMFLYEIGSLTETRLVLFGFLLAMLIEFEIVYGVLFIAGVVLSMCFWYRRVLPRRTFLFSWFGMLIGEAPRMLFELRNDFVQTRSLLAAGNSGENLWRLYTNRDWLLHTSLSSVLPGSQTMQNLLVLLILVFFVRYFNEFSIVAKRFTATVLTIIGVFWLAIFLYPRDFWQYYLFGLPVLYSVAIASVFSLFWKKFFPISVFVLALYVIMLLRPVEMLRAALHPDFTGDAAVYHNQENVVKRIVSGAPADFKYIAYTPPQIDHTWNYLFWYFTRKTTNQHTLSENPSVMYVIIEPDDNYPDRIAQWLDIRKRDGVVVRQSLYPGGIIVQERRLRWK